MLGIVEIIGALICITLIHFTGKRPLTLVSTVGCGICFALTATYAYFLADIPGEGVSNVISNVSTIDVGFNATFGTVNSTQLQEPNQITKIFIDALSNSEVRSSYAWIPLTLLLGSALLSHSGKLSNPFRITLNS